MHVYCNYALTEFPPKMERRNTGNLVTGFMV